MLKASNSTDRSSLYMLGFMIYQNKLKKSKMNDKNKWLYPLIA